MPTVGHLGSPGITPVHGYYVPIRHPLVFDPLPGRAGYRVYLAPDISDRDEEGFSSCLVYPCQRAVATTPPEGSIRRPVWDQSYCLHPTDAGSTSGATHFRGHLCIHFRYGPLTRSPLLQWLCRWASGDRFPLHLPSKLQGSDLLPWWDCLPLNTPALTGHTSVRADFPHTAPTLGE